MLADNQEFEESQVKESSKKGVFSCLGCNNKNQNSFITVPVVEPTYYGNKIIFHNIELDQFQNSQHHPSGIANLGDLTEDQLSQLNNQNLLSGFNNRFNFLQNKMVNENFNKNLEPDNLEEDLLDENQQNKDNNQFSGLKNDENETSSNIDNLFENVSIDHVRPEPFCNLLGTCFNRQTSDNQSMQTSMNYEMFRLTGYMGSLLDPPEFVDLETIDSVQNENLFYKCMRPLRNKFYNNFNNQKFSSILSQTSIVPSDVGCFNSCTKKLKKYVDTDKLSTLATTSSYGLKNLYNSFSSFSQNNLSSNTEKFFESFSNNFFQENNNYTKFFSMDNDKDKNFFNFGTNNNKNNLEEKKLKPKYKNVKPNSFKLHAVEIHQYIPLPNFPSSRFVNDKNNKNNFKNNSDNYLSNCFFNPNTTGLTAPMMNNLLNGSNNYPDIYNLNIKDNRLNTEDFSMCVLPLDKENGFNENSLRFVE